MNWDLSAIYKQAWQLTKKNPKLWILGLAVALFVVSGSSNSNSSSGSSSSSSSSKSTTSSTVIPPGSDKLNLPSFIPLRKDLTKTELTDSLQQFGQRFNTNIVMGLKTVPITIYGLIIVEFVVLGLVGAAIRLLSSSWSSAALIYGCAQADYQHHVSLTEAGIQGRRHIKSMLAVAYLPILKLLLYWLAGSIAILIVTLLKIPFLMIFLIPGLIVLTVVYLIRIIPAQLWAYRFAVLYHQPYAEAMANGRTKAKGMFWNMFGLGLLNSLISLCATFVLLIPLGGISIVAIIWVISAPTFQNIMTALIAFIVAAIIASPILLAARALLQTFIYSAWHFGFKIVNYLPANNP